ncbi:MAG: HsdR family type I site-specific deoxyribonuclease [Archaeoglobaceae archaeon]|nr:HsdR family type I site-specific deoxyribonuclease [Archaeoglobaceae archaeon]
MFNEQNTVENYLIEQLKERGWTYIPGDDLSRDSFEEPLLTSNLVRKIEELNKDIGISEEEVRLVLNELKLKGSGQDGCRKILEYLKFGVPVKFEKERVVNYVQLFDYENIRNNELIVSNQVVYHNVDKHIRADIVLYVNGIPVTVIECKSPVSFTASWYDAYIQIKRYEKDIPELSKYLQIGVAAESIAKYFPIVPWVEKTSIYEWKTDDKNSFESIIDMLSPETLLDIIRNFILFRLKYGDSTKVITRYMQYRAANRIVNRVINNLEGKEEKNRGLIWHWQGSGKTLTMIFAGLKLFYSRKTENPSIFYIVDRRDLEEQMKQELNSLKISFDSISSVNEMKKVITHDDYKGKRGILLTLVHKFRPQEMEELAKYIRELSKTEETIRTRKNIVAFIDEGHRTHYGALSAQMRAILGDSFYFAFTGTPISKKGKDTYAQFSYPPDENYLDRYFITDSIKDGFTVKIAYKPRLENEVHLKKENLDAFIKFELEEIPEEYREKVETDIGRHLSASRVVLENPEMIRKVAEDIKVHFTDNVEGKFKAMVVAESRKACVLFKKELDRLFPKEYSEVVMTVGPDEKEKEIAAYYRDTTQRFNETEMNLIREKIVEDYKSEEFPKILIVTDMLLTGFDAPVLQTLYLYKLIKEHRLLQAIARTNRPYLDIKEAGVIIDYVGILDQFKKAFEMYSKEEMRGALYRIDDLKAEFREEITKLLDIFKGIPKDRYDRRTLLKSIEILTAGDEKGKKFLEDYKKLRRVFELLGPDEIIAEYYKDFKWLSAIYTYYSRQVLRARPDSQFYFKKYFKKTLKHIYEASEIKEVEKNFPEITFDENYIKKLAEKVNSREEQAANIVFTLNKLVLVDKKSDPIYIAIADKVEQILEKWKQKTKDYEQLYLEGVEVIKGINRLKKRKKELQFSDLEYAILLIMEKELGKRKEFIDDVRELHGLLKEHMYEGFTLHPTAIKNIERTLRPYLRKKIAAYKITYGQMNAVYEKIRDMIKEYGKDYQD